MLSPPPLSLIAKVLQFFENFTILSFTMALGAHMRPYSYMYCAPHRDGVLHKEASRTGEQSANGQGTFLRKLRATTEINAKIEKPSLSQDVGWRQSPNQILPE